MKLTQQDWMTAPETRAVLAALGEARFVGGAVRNTLMGKPVADVDIATPLVPEDVVKRLEAAGLRAIPTGIEHGTITAISAGKTFEVTTLRRDVSTDGRRATVAFTTDWKEDAGRRDFTLNALYATADGEIFDYFGGLDDLKAGRVRFIGDAVQRIREDYLRILRLFRFHAWYGKGELDVEALRASAAEIAGFERNVSGERIQKEMLRLLEAPSPTLVLRTMAASGILVKILPGSFLFDRLERLARIDIDNFFEPDGLLRLAAFLSDDDTGKAEYVAEEWRLSNARAARLEDLISAREKIVSYLSIREVRKLLYRLGTQRFRDRVFLRWAEDDNPATFIQWRAMLAIADGWERPKFPLDGGNVMAAGVPQGPLIGRVMAEVEDWWIDADFTDDEFSIAERLKAVVQALKY